jgi:hypothetical protein
MYTIKMEIVGADWDAIEKALEDGIERGIAELNGEIETEWHTEAHRTLGTRAEEYNQDISFSATREAVEVTLGETATAMEFKQQPYDLKPGFLRHGEFFRRIIPMNDGSRFRTVTATSSGWIHPGFPGADIREAVQDKMDNEIVPRVFGKLLGNIQV